MTDVNHPPQNPENPAVTEGQELSTAEGEPHLSFAELAQSGHAPTQLNPDAEPVLSVENLKMYFPVKSSGLVRRTIGHVQAVDGISFQVPRGGSLGLVGESGCGKSTTGRLITRLYTPTAGSMRFGPDQVDLAGMSNRELKPLRRDVQMIFQDPYTPATPSARSSVRRWRCTRSSPRTRSCRGSRRSSRSWGSTPSTTTATPTSSPAGSVSASASPVP